MEEAYEIWDYLPIEDLEVKDYVDPLFKSASVTFERGEYQFSYFALHLIFMTYIYTAVWKIGQYYREKYHDCLLFVRPYNGSKVNFKDIKSVFDFSDLPEKDILEFFTLIGVDKSYIGQIKKLIDTRNQMAHATGKFQITSEIEFNEAIRELLSVSQNLQANLNLTIRKWYEMELLNYAKKVAPSGIPAIKDYVNDIFINNYSFSKKDLEVCKDFGLNEFWKKHTNLLSSERSRIKDFHKVLKEKHVEISENY